MFRLRCSFCRRHAADVAKLVAGPRVYICDRCVVIATEVMNEPVDPDQPAAAVSRPLRTWREWFKGHPSARRAVEVVS